MAQFPASIPSYAGFISTHTLQADNHAAQHNSEQTDIVAIATKVGTGASTPANNTVLRGNGTGTSGFDQVHLAADVSGVLSVSNGGTGNTSGAYTPAQVDAAILAAKQALYPVGCIYVETTGINPNTTFGFGTWSQTGRGRVLVGQGTSDQLFSAGATGGESNHTLTTSEMPVHNHGVTDPTHSHQEQIATAGGSGTGITGTSNLVGNTGSNQTTVTAATGITINNAGSGNSHNNLQPYQVVYYWTRTA